MQSWRSNKSTGTLKWGRRNTEFLSTENLVRVRKNCILVGVYNKIQRIYQKVLLFDTKSGTSKNILNSQNLILRHNHICHCSSLSTRWIGYGSGEERRYGRFETLGGTQNCYLRRYKMSGSTYPRVSPCDRESWVNFLDWSVEVGQKTISTKI